MGTGASIGKRRARWLDLAKFFAIIAVMVDHTHGVLYDNTLIFFFSFFSVSVFIITMGVTTVWSYDSGTELLYRKVVRRCLAMIRPYVIATLIYGIAQYGSVDFEKIINHLINFNMAPPFYYVALYIQLVLVSPIIYKLTVTGRKHGIWMVIVSILFVISISVLTTNNTSIFEIYGGGGMLFGGTFLILLFAGMWLGVLCKKINTTAAMDGVLTAVSGVLLIAWCVFLPKDSFDIDTKLHLGNGINPPGITLGVYAILLLLVIFFCDRYLTCMDNPVITRALDFLAVIGQHTLYIFLYHRLFLDYFIPAISTYMGIKINNMPIKWIIYFGLMIAGSMLMEFVLEKFHSWVRSAYVEKVTAI